MAARRYLYLYMCTVVILTVTIKAQSTTNSPQSQQGNYVSDSTSDEKSSLEKGVDVLYSDIMHGFLDAVVPGRFFSNEDPGAISKCYLNLCHIVTFMTPHPTLPTSRAHLECQSRGRSRLHRTNMSEITYKIQV